MTNVNDAKFKAACEEYIREALADGLNREQVIGKLEEMTKIAIGESIGEAFVQIFPRYGDLNFCHRFRLSEFGLLSLNRGLGDPKPTGPT
jgi:hypothetical protein